MSLGNIENHAISLKSLDSPKSGHRMLRARSAAAYLGMSKSWLDKSRLLGTGPQFVKIGSRVVYDIRDLDRWLAEKTVTKTE